MRSKARTQIRLFPRPITLFVVALAGCAQTRVKVLHDLTGEPVSGVTVVPVVVVNNFFGSPCVMPARKTDREGVATVPYGRDKLHSIFIEHPVLRQVHPSEKPHTDGDHRLLYVGPP